MAILNFFKVSDEMNIIDEFKILPTQLRKGMSYPSFVSEAVKRNQGSLTKDGALLIQTGEYTGRSPRDRYIVEDDITRDTVAFGQSNQPMKIALYEKLKEKVKAYLVDRELFEVKARTGASEKHSLRINLLLEDAAQAAFARQIFIPDTLWEDHQADFTVIGVPGLKAEGPLDGVRSEVFVVISFTDRLILIGGTRYSGEIKKAVFSVMNFLLPQAGILPMHCSANVGSDGHSALFFGLSGTGKTTLSTDPTRALIGDDEHGWSMDEVFNLEGGCYAKCIGLDPVKEKEIYEAIRFGCLLENVVVDPLGNPDYLDSTKTENTRATYPLHFIENHVPSMKAPHPKTIFFLTADAFGVVPPISKLSRTGAMYHFMSGYTSKLAGTERGVLEPETTFSALFGEPFMPRPVEVYAQLLGEMIDKHDTQVFLVNTGWVGGQYGRGHRIALKYTRRLIDAALKGEFRETPFESDEIFQVEVPVQVTGVPEELLFPRRYWKNPQDYEHTAKLLAKRFEENFRRFPMVSADIRGAGPQVR